MALEKVFECYDEGELSVIKSLLEANGIPYFVQNEHFGSLYPGVSMSFNLWWRNRKPKERKFC